MCDDCLAEFRDKLKKKIDWYEEQAATLQQFGFAVGILEEPSEEEPAAPVEDDLPAFRPIPAPSVNGHAKTAGSMEKLKKLLADGPKPFGELVEACGSATATIRKYLQEGPFEQIDPSNGRSPWRLAQNAA